MNKVAQRLILVVVLLIECAGCSLTPQYERPELNMPTKFQDRDASAESVANVPWWKILNDPKLQELVKLALAENRDLQTSAARIAEARALLGFVRADQYPFVDFSASASRSDLGTSFGALGPVNDYWLSGDLTFEVDLWGKLRSATEAQRQELFASEYAYRSLTISLIAEVADFYFKLIDLDQRLLIAERTLENRKHATGIIRARFTKGVLPELDVNQAEIEQEDTEIELHSFERERRQIENALRVLLGGELNSIERATAQHRDALQLDLPVGVPASLLERRPDILAAEAFVKSEFERIGVAKAARLPSLSIIGTLGLRSSESEDLFSSESRSWDIGGGLFGPLIDWGKNKSRVEAEKARADQALKQYEQTVLNAVREVEDALIGMRTFEAENASRTRQLKAAANAARLARARYDDGVSAYLEVLDTERSLFSAEIGASATLQRYFSSAVQLYKALGGGWDITFVPVN